MKKKLNEFVCFENAKFLFRIHFIFNFSHTTEAAAAAKGGLKRLDVKEEAVFFSSVAIWRQPIYSPSQEWKKILQGRKIKFRGWRGLACNPVCRGNSWTSI